MVHDVAIIASVIPERFPLMCRSLVTWQRSIQFSGLDANIYLYIEGDREHALSYIPAGVGVSVEFGERSGTHITGYNHWYEKVRAKTHLFTHGEVMFPKNTVEVAHRYAEDDVFVAFKMFWLPQYMTEHLDDYGWQSPEELEQTEALYQADPKEHGPYYWNTDVRTKTNWESTTTFAYNAATAAKIFPFPNLGHQGFDDPLHAGFRQRLGIQNLTIMEPVLFHQWHPQTWDGNMGLAVAEATQEIQKRFG